MSFVTESRLAGLLDLGICLPTTTLQAGDWIIAATVPLPAGMQFTFRKLNLTLLDGSVNGAVVNLADPTNVVLNPNYSLAYCGFIKDFEATTNPSAAQFVGSKNDVVVGNDAGIFERDSTLDDLIVTTPGNYSFVVVNNCQDIDLRLLITGQVRVDVT